MTDDPRQDGRVVPVYAVTGGRTRAGDHDLPIEAVVTAAEPDGAGALSSAPSRSDGEGDRA